MRFLAISLQFWVVLYACNFAGKILPQFVLGWFSSLACVFTCVFLTAWIVEITQESLLNQTTVSPKGKAVVITGCDTGFGHILAKALDKRKFKVYACCLSSSSDGAQDLRDTCSNQLQTVQMDVTSNQSVQNAKEFIAEDLKEHELWAVVNNAGVLKGFHTELSSIKDYEDCMNVNALGMVRVTLAFLPLLRKCKGRVVNVCSLAGRVSCNYMAAYDMSKSATIAFNEVLAIEMREVGVRVIAIEPEFFRTPMCSRGPLTKQLETSLESVDEERLITYGDAYIQKAKEFFLAIFLRSSTNIELVVGAMEKAVILQYPADAYKPCRNAFTRIFFLFAERAPFPLKFLFMNILHLMMGVPKPKNGLSVCQRLAM